MVIPDRTCEVCGNTFSRQRNCPPKFFVTKKTCSTECYGVLRKRNVVGFQKGHVSFSEKGRFEKGSIAWNKGVKGLHPYMNISGLNSNGDIPHNKGKTLSPETIEKIKIARARQDNNGLPRKEKHWNWQGGKTNLRKLLQKTYLYIQWRKSVFERDDYTCQHCNVRGNYIHADHIKSYSSIINEYKITTVEEAKKCAVLWDILNGRTLCVACHKKTSTYGGKSLNQVFL